jgi:hypothetical protein
MGILNLIRGRNDAHLAAAAAPPGTAQPTESKTGDMMPEHAVKDDFSASDSDTLSLEAQNEKEVQLHPDEITHNADLGIQKAEAAALVWSKKAVYLTYAW